MTRGGGLLQLVAQGKQDIFLTGNPQVTWFKMVYRRYTNFAIESQIIQFDTQPDFGRRVTCVIPRKGDLLSSMWLDVTLPAIFDTCGNQLSYPNSAGHALIQEISIDIGEQEIDKQTGEWMELWSNYTVPTDKIAGWQEMIGQVPRGGIGNKPSYLVGLYGPLHLHIPLRFWFCKSPGLALPLLALQYHAIRINITLRPLNQMFIYDTPSVCPMDITAATNSITKMNLYGDYIHLDIEERRRFVANTHEYLIEQVQYTPSFAIDPTAQTVQIPMEFNNPIRELFWFIQRDAAVNARQWFNYTNSTISETAPDGQQNQIASAMLRIEGYDRFDERDADYFRLVQPFQYHTVIPIDAFTYSYSFCFRPEDLQPSGSLNASRLNTMTLQLTFPDGSTQNPLVVPARGTANARIYALNHNILRVVDGFGGILFRV
jgi:hypothetical protein